MEKSPLTPSKTFKLRALMRFIYRITVSLPERNRYFVYQWYPGPLVQRFLGGEGAFFQKGPLHC